MTQLGQRIIENLPTTEQDILLWKLELGPSQESYSNQMIKENHDIPQWMVDEYFVSWLNRLMRTHPHLISYSFRFGSTFGVEIWVAGVEIGRWRKYLFAFPHNAGV